MSNWTRNTSKGKFGELIKTGDYKSLSKRILSFKKKSEYKHSMLGYRNLSIDYNDNCDKYLKIVKKYINI